MISTQTSVTLGIDLAAQPASTAACVLAWEAGTVAIVNLGVGVTDADIERLARDAEVTAIDAPFGWPVDFTTAVAGYAAGGPWRSAASDRLQLRETDRRVRAITLRRPLSVSADKIAVPAMRAAGLLTAADQVVRPRAMGRTE